MTKLEIAGIGAQYAGTVAAAEHRYEAGNTIPISGDETTTDRTGKAMRKALSDAAEIFNQLREAIVKDFVPAVADAVRPLLNYAKATALRAPRNRHRICTWTEHGDFDVCRHGHVTRYSGKPVLHNGRKPR